MIERIVGIVDGAGGGGNVGRGRKGLTVGRRLDSMAAVQRHRDCPIPLFTSERLC
jgi:hypothetical protein